MQSLFRRAVLLLAQCLDLVIFLPARLVRASSPAPMGPGFLLPRRSKRRRLRSASAAVLIGALCSALALSSLVAPASATETITEPIQSAPAEEPAPAPDPVAAPPDPVIEPEVSAAETTVAPDENGVMVAPEEEPAALSSSDPLPPISGSNGLASGSRGAASMVEHALTDQINLEWNPTNGNILLTGELLNLNGVTRDMSVSWRYNSLNDSRPSFNVGTTESAVRVTTDNKIVYTADDGGTYTFVPKTGGGFTMPPGLNASIKVFTTTDISIRFNETGYVNNYVKSGDIYVLRSQDDAVTGSPNRISYFDTSGRLYSTLDNKNQEIKYYYEDSSNEHQPSRIVDTTVYRSINAEYDSAYGQMTHLTDATGSITAFQYNYDGKISKVTDGKGNITSLEYDTAGRAAKITYATGTPEESIWTAAYPTSTTTTFTDPNNRTATYLYNAAKQVTKVTDPNGNTLSGAFDAHDNRTSATDGLGNLSTATYNPNNTLSKVTSPAGATGGTGGDVTFTYPAATTADSIFEYRPTGSVDSEGNSSTFAYDTATTGLKQTNTPGLLGGQPKSFYQGDTAGTTCGGKPGQLCKTVDGKGNTTSYTYDAAANPVTITRPAPLGVITNTFDDAGRVATSKDGKGQILTYSYDNNDRLTQTREGSTCVPATCVTYTYDANGNLTQRVDASGTTTYTYDAQNRATAKTTGGTTTTLTYDGASNILSYTDPTGTVAYKYDPANRLISLAEPGGSCPATPVFPNATKCSGFEYDKNNRRTVTKYPNGVKNTTVFDKAGRTTSITATNTAGTVLTKRAYTYTVGTTGKDGQLRKTMTTETGAVSTYTYDGMQRLTQTVTGTITEAWTYDANGNRLTAAKTGATTVRSAYNAADQLCWTSTGTGTCAAPPTGATLYTYDANGNQTNAGGARPSTWNTFDQMTNHWTTSFSYAGLGNTERLTLSNNAGATSFLNGSLGISRQTNANGTMSFIRDPEGALISMRDSAGASYYYTTDALGSTVLLTDSAQAKAVTYLYDSWGNTTTQTGTLAPVNPWRYAGGYKDDSTGYTKFGARYYSPGIGRFNQTDPSGQDPHYTYAANDAVNQSDPSGEAVPLLAIGAALIFRSLAPATARTFATRVAGSRIGPMIGKQIMDPKNAKWFGKNQGYNTGGQLRTGVSVRKGQPGTERPAFRTGNTPSDHFWLDGQP